MSAGSKQDSASLPSLEQLENALVHRNKEKQRQLRKQLVFTDWREPTQNFPTPEFGMTDDSGHDRLDLMLLHFGPNCLKCRDADGNTLVHLTAKTCETTKPLELICETLSKSGDNSLDCFSAKGKNKNTAVHYAAENRSNAALKWLVEKLGPACLKVSNALPSNAVHIAAQHQGADSLAFINEQLEGMHFKHPGELRRTPFHCAAANETGDEALRWLIREVGPDPLTVKDGQHNTVVHLAARFQDAGTMELLKETLGNQVFALYGADGQTVVHSAARNTATCSALAWCVKELGAECLMARDGSGRVPLHLAAQCQDDRSLAMAVDALGDKCLTAWDSAGRGMAHYAAMNERSNAALRYVVGRCGPECLKRTDDSQRMPVHLVGWHQGVDSLRLLQRWLGGAAFNLLGRNRRILAHYAAENHVGNKAAMLNWLVREVGPQCLRMWDDQNVTAAKIGY